MLSWEELKHLAKLARLGLKEKELERFQSDLSRIVGFVSQLQELKTNKVEPEIQITGLASVFREDKEEGFVAEKGPALLDQAPATNENLLIVPEVFKEEE